MAQQQQQGRGGGRGYNQEPERKLPTAQQQNYFVEGALNAELLEQMEGLAKEMAKVSASQLRRFYGDVTAFDRRMAQDRNLPDTAIRAQMSLLKARAAYAFRRDEKNIPQAFLQFFVDHAASVKSRKDFTAFRRIFETLIAYHKFHEVKQGGRG